MTYIAANHFLLSEPGELYKLIIDSADEGILVLNEEQKIIFANEQVQLLTEVSKESLLLKDISEIFTSDDCEHCIEMKALIKEGKKCEIELRVKLQSQGYKWVKVISTPIIQENKFRGSLLLIRDITEEHEIELESQENQWNYSTLFEHIPVPIWEEDFSKIKEYIDDVKSQGIKDVENYFREHPDKLNECVGLLIVNNINQAVVEINEAQSKEEVIQRFRKFLNEKSAEYALKQIVAIANNEAICEFDAELRTFKNNIRYVHFKWIVVKGHEKTYKRVILSTTDYTERIIAENLSLQHSNREKAVLLKEIHHRVKNNMQIITSLLNLQSYTIDDPGVKDLFTMSLQRISSMASIHEMLYRSDDFSGIHYKDYLDNLLYSLIDSFKGRDNNVTYTLNMDDIVLNINTSIPLGLLVNEIITNSLKHGIPGDRQGHIHLSMATTSDGKFKLTISDDGVGIPSHVNLKNCESLGMQLIHSLAEQLNGSLHIESNSEGTTFTLAYEELEAHPENPIS